MPKGETSRPNTRKEKQAVKAKKALKAGVRGKSPVNAKKAIMGKRNTKDTQTLTNRNNKASARKYGNKQEKTTGKSLTSRVNGKGKIVKRK